MLTKPAVLANGRHTVQVTQLLHWGSVCSSTGSKSTATTAVLPHCLL